MSQKTLIVIICLSFLAAYAGLYLTSPSESQVKSCEQSGRESCKLVMNL